jgi:hypothetical protein
MREIRRNRCRPRGEDCHDGIPEPHGTVEVDAVSITEKLFEGLVGREDEVAITDGPTGAR